MWKVDLLQFSTFIQEDYVDNKQLVFPWQSPAILAQSLPAQQPAWNFAGLSHSHSCVLWDDCRQTHIILTKQVLMSCPLTTSNLVPFSFCLRTFSSQLHGAVWWPSNEWLAETIRQITSVGVIYPVTEIPMQNMLGGQRQRQAGKGVRGGPWPQDAPLYSMTERSLQSF